VREYVEAVGEGIRVFILDDHELVRQGLRDLLEHEGMEIVGESESAQEAARRIPALKPHVAVLDGRLADGTGIEVCREVRSVDPHIRCLILTSYDDEQAMRAAVLAGAAGYVLKQIRSHDLANAIRRAAAGESLFAPGIQESVVNGLTHEDISDPLLDTLSPQERRVLHLIGQGLTNRQIGEELFLAEKTVKNYVSSLLAKLGFERRTQAALYLAQAGQPR
jgi:DNA-binding NarL/FixJ family response regulator